MDIVRQSIGKALDQIGIGHDLFKRWSGHARSAEARAALHVGIVSNRRCRRRARAGSSTLVPEAGSG